VQPKMFKQLVFLLLVTLRRSLGSEKLFTSLEIRYPLNLLDPSLLKDKGHSNWKDPSVYDISLAKLSDIDHKVYYQHAHAQCQEDIWLYEKWFYGMSNGVILESGALDGKTYSTSWLFEMFANWTAVHVGKLSSDLLCSWHFFLFSFSFFAFSLCRGRPNQF
jgi:hypothetical protein